MSGDILFENQIAIVVTVKNESRYIEEWLDYHYRIGVDKFYIYDNDSEDRSISERIVDYQIFDGIMTQLRTYNHALKRHMFDCKYMGIIDADEFIFVKNGQSLIEFLDEHFSKAINIGGLSINWRMFGSNGHLKYNPEPVIERFTHRAQDDHVNNLFFKTILNPRRALSINGAHFVNFRMGCACYDEDLLEMREQKNNKRNPASRVQINHYMTKSQEEFLKKKSRGQADNLGKYTDTQFDTDDRNEIEDTSLRDFRRELIKLPRRESYHGFEIQLENLITMLIPSAEFFDGMNLNQRENFFEGQLEKFITCFYLSHTIPNLDKDFRKMLEKLSLKSILECLNSNEIFPADCLLLLDCLPKIFSTRLPEALKLIKRCESLCNVLLYNTIVHSNDASTHERVFKIKIAIEDLKSFLNGDFFNE